MVVELKDLITWGIGASAALIAAIGVFLQIRRDLAERRRRQDENDRAWRIDILEAYDEGEWRGARLVLTDPVGQACRLLKMTALKPRGTELAILQRRRDSTTNAEMNADVPALKGNSIEVGTGLTGYRPGRGPQDIVDMNFHIRLPPKLRQRPSVRAIIRLTVSDNSRTRRIRNICITSDEIMVDSTKHASVM